MHKKDTVIFDLDGTLLNTLDDLKNSVNYALESNGYPARTKEEIRQFVGNGMFLLIQRALPSGTDNPDFERILADFKEHCAIHCNDLTKPYDGIMELLGADTVHDHLCNILPRHRHSPDYCVTVNAVIYPMFKMMLISSVMVYPGGRKACGLSLCIVGTSVSLIISASHRKLCPGIFGQVVKDSLLIKPYLKTVFHY